MTKTLNYGGTEMTLVELEAVAARLDREVAHKRELAARPTLFDMLMPKALRDDYLQQALDREDEAKCIRKFIEKNS